MYLHASNIVKNPNNYSKRDLREAKRVVKEATTYVLCPNCKEAYISLRLLNAGYNCHKCTLWINTYEKT